MLLINFLLTASCITDCDYLLSIISLGMTYAYYILGINHELKIILLSLLKLASKSRITQSLDILITLGFFSSITDIPFVYRISRVLFLMAILTSLHLIVDK